MESKNNNGRVPLISKIAYGFGDVGCNFSWMFVSNFLMIFYTDVFGISMAAVSGLMLFSRFWDAINDPIIGGLTDKTKTRWGRYRPWLLFAAPITAIILMLSFWAHPDWSNTAKIVYMIITYCLLVLGYTCVNIPYGTLCGAMTQNIDERAKINTSRSVAAMIAIGIINIITVPLITTFGKDSPKTGYLTVAIIYGCIFAICHFFCFAKTKEVVQMPEKEKISIKVQLKAVLHNRPYLLALIGQILFGFTLYGRNADILYYFTYVEGDASYYTTYSMCIIIPSIVGAACFQPVFKKTNNKGRAASLFALLTGCSMLLLYLFSVKENPAVFYILSGLTQFFFSGFNTAIYAIIPDCAEYGQWKTGLRNDGFQYAFISLGNKVGMAIGTALLAGMLGKFGYVANQQQNDAVLAVMKHAFTTIPGVLWLVTAVVLFFYRLNKKYYNEIVEELKNGKKYDVIALGELLIDFTELGVSENGMKLFEQNPGGAPANLLTAVSHMGYRTAMIGKIGTDMHGRFLKKTLEQEGICTDYIVEDDSVFTTLAFVAINENGERNFSFARKPGADTCLSVKELNFQALLGCKVFHFGSLSLSDEPSRTATVEAVKAAKAAGALISFDPNYRASLWKNKTVAVEAIQSVLPYADMLKISDEESVLLTGEDEYSRAVGKLLKQGPKLIAVTLGDQGVFLATQERCEQIPGFLAEVVDTTGAGDSFWGGFLAKYLDHQTDLQTMSWENWRNCAKFGNATASLCVRKRGGIPAIPEKKEVIQILQG